MGHAAAGSALGFGAARFALGLVEAGTPRGHQGCRRVVSKRERALATGIFNAASNVARCWLRWRSVDHRPIRWRWAFLLTGAVGFLG